MTTINLHPKLSVKATMKKSLASNRRWIEIEADGVLVVIYEPAVTGKLSIDRIAEALADPLELLHMEQQAAEHDAIEAAHEAIEAAYLEKAPPDQSNGLKISDETADDYPDMPF